MLIPNQLIEVKWSRNNCTHYKSLGYIFTKLGDTFLAHAEELMPGSSAIVKIECDQCHTICSTTYKSYLKSLELHPGHYFCRVCVQNTSATRDKIEQSFLEKYGDTNLFHTQYYKDKAKATNLDKLGVEFPMQSPIVQEKSRVTTLKNYGYIGLQNPITRLKAQETLAKMGEVNYSTQQQELFDILSAQYTCEFNKPLSTLNLDIALSINNIKIDIETDGDYWHQDKQKDRSRDEFVKSQGYKVLRIRYSHQLPDTQIILEGIQQLLNSDHTFYQINAEDCRYDYNNN